MNNTHWVKFITDLSSLPPFFEEWLLKPQILTRALKRIYANVDVKVLRQTKDSAFAEECEILQISVQSKPLIREIFLVGDGLARTFARVVIAPHTYARYRTQLDALHDAPIGETLLYDSKEEGKAVSRSAFEFACLDQNQPLFKIIENYFTQSLPVPLFGRRSVFKINDFKINEFPLLITEFFLPTLSNYRPNNV